MNNKKWMLSMKVVPNAKLFTNRLTAVADPRGEGGHSVTTRFSL